MNAAPREWVTEPQHEKTTPPDHAAIAVAKMVGAPVDHSPYPLKAERGGTQLQTPLPVVLVDTREKVPFSFSRFQGWFAAIERKPLKLGDYSVAGLEDVCVVERKDLGDLVRSLSPTGDGGSENRKCFVDRLRRMSEYPHRLLVITSSLSEVKSPYPFGGMNPNRVTQSLVAVLAGLQVPFLFTETHELGEEIVASYLYQVFLYDWLEKNGHGRFIGDNDL